MAGLNFGFRQSIAESYDDTRSRYIPSSVYSGPGPEVEGPLRPVQPMYALNGRQSGTQNGYHAANGQSQQFTARPRNSDALNISDPVAMHLLTETALGDSKSFEVLSFEELEQLKREKVLLRNRIEATKRKLALESKMRDAAQSLNRLYTSGKSGNSAGRGHLRNFSGSKGSNGSVSDISSQTEGELAASNRKIEELSSELKRMELRLEDSHRRILEHTAGILQITHRGLKKNLRRHELPRSPESMTSPVNRGVPGGPVHDDFDERSFYPVPDYVNEFMATSPMTPILTPKPRTVIDPQALDETFHSLQALTSRMHRILLQSDASGNFSDPPQTSNGDATLGNSAQIQAQLAYLSQSLEVLSNSHQQTMQESDNVNNRIYEMLEKTNSVSRSPLLAQDEDRGEDVASQLAYSTRVLQQLQSRVETLVEQKDILTRQIQQQRELNTKSDAQRDAQIRDLTEELAETKRLHTMSEKESQDSQNQVSQLIDQLDRARSDAQLLEQQRGMNDSNAVQAEREARKEAEKILVDEIESKQHINAGLQADIAKLQNDMELQSQQRIQQINELTKARDEAGIKANSHRSESEKLLEQIASIQTELTMARAELDGAYGSRAQRAADVSSNPAIQKQIDGLRLKNDELQKELKVTIEEYEQMTKDSIEFEKERENLEASIDSLRDKCEALESQLSEEKLKTLGSKAGASTDTTSTMVLKNEFKKMMRDTRSENTKALRIEQEERRKLEAIVRQMKKDMGTTSLGKIGNSPSILTTGLNTPA